MVDFYCRFFFWITSSPFFFWNLLFPFKTVNYSCFLTMMMIPKVSFFLASCYHNAVLVDMVLPIMCFTNRAWLDLVVLLLSKSLIFLPWNMFPRSLFTWSLLEWLFHQCYGLVTTSPWCFSLTPQSSSPKSSRGILSPAQLPADLHQVFTEIS